MGAITSQITSLTIVYSTVYPGEDHRKHQSSASLGTGEFPTQMASNAENVSLSWRHYEQSVRRPQEGQPAPVVGTGLPLNGLG